MAPQSLQGGVPAAAVAVAQHLYWSSPGASQGSVVPTRSTVPTSSQWMSYRHVADPAEDCGLPAARWLLCPAVTRDALCAVPTAYPGVCSGFLKGLLTFVQTRIQLLDTPHFMQIPNGGGNITFRRLLG